MIPVFAALFLLFLASPAGSNHQRHLGRALSGCL